MSINLWLEIEVVFLCEIMSLNEGIQNEVLADSPDDRNAAELGRSFVREMK